MVHANLFNTAIVGAIWSIMARFGVKFVGLAGTLLITNELSPEVMGEVGVAIVVAMTAQFASDLAFGQYIVVKSRDNPQAVFHALFYNVLTVLMAAVVLVLIAEPLGRQMGVAQLPRYLPVMALSLILERIARIPESVALRDLRFKMFAAGTAVSEVWYVVVSVGMATLGYGGDAIVWGNVAQFALRLVWFAAAVRPQDWLRPARITWEQTKVLLRFGVPLSLANVAHVASFSWDRLIITKLFGTHTHGIYFLGKSLSAVPADNVGDAVADVAMPSFARMEASEAKGAVVKACHLVAIVVYPMAAGLAVVSPTLVHALFREEWHGIALPLTILAAVSLIDPLGDLLTSYLKARDKPMAVMWLQIGFVAVLLLSTFVLGTFFGLYGACFGVGVGMSFRALASLYVAYRIDGVAMGDMMGGLCRVALASCVMAASVLLVREYVSSGLSNGVLALGVEIAAGALSFVPAAFVLANPIVKEVVGWVRNRS